MTLFNDNQKRRILDAFQQKCEDARCPMCSSVARPDWYSMAQGEFNESGEEDEDIPFILVGSYTPLEVTTFGPNGNSVPLNKTVPAVSFVCKQCGYIAMFSSRVLCSMPETLPPPPSAAA